MVGNRIDGGGWEASAVPVGDAATGSATTTAGLNLRQGPGTTYAVITVMPTGAAVELRGEAQNGYYPLSYNGTTGWAAGSWLSIGASPAPVLGTIERMPIGTAWHSARKNRFASPRCASGSSRAAVTWNGPDT